MSPPENNSIDSAFAGAVSACVLSRLSSTYPQRGSPATTPAESGFRAAFHADTHPLAPASPSVDELFLVGSLTRVMNLFPYVIC